MVKFSIIVWAWVLVRLGYEATKASAIATGTAMPEMPGFCKISIFVWLLVVYVILEHWFVLYERLIRGEY